MTETLLVSASKASGPNDVHNDASASSQHTPQDAPARPRGSLKLIGDDRSGSAKSSRPTPMLLNIRETTGRLVEVLLHPPRPCSPRCKSSSSQTDSFARSSPECPSPANSSHPAPPCSSPFLTLHRKHDFSVMTTPSGAGGRGLMTRFLLGAGPSGGLRERSSGVGFTSSYFGGLCDCEKEGGRGGGRGCGGGCIWNCCCCACW